MLFSSRVRVRIIFSVCLVSCYAQVFIQLSVAIVSLHSIIYTREFGEHCELPKRGLWPKLKSAHTLNVKIAHFVAH